MFTKNIYTSGLPLKKFLTVVERANGGFCVAGKDAFFQTKLLAVIAGGFEKILCSYLG